MSPIEAFIPNDTCNISIKTQTKETLRIQYITRSYKAFTLYNTHPYTDLYMVIKSME